MRSLLLLTFIFIACDQGGTTRLPSNRPNLTGPCEQSYIDEIYTQLTQDGCKKYFEYENRSQASDSEKRSCIRAYDQMLSGRRNLNCVREVEVEEGTRLVTFKSLLAGEKLEIEKTL